MTRLPFEKALEWVTELFRQAGMDRDTARLIADMFVVTEPAGIHSHGLALAVKHYDQAIKNTMNPTPNVRLLHRTGAIARVDGDGGPGPVVLEQALSIGMDMARSSGIATVWVTNLQHYGAGFYHVQKPITDGMIALLCANAPANVAPFGGAARLFGTNPLTLAAPAGKYPPYVLDMATTVLAGNKIEQARREGQSVPAGVGIDRNGNPCVDPAEILDNGALLPFGGAKGSGLSGMVNILSGVLSGGAFMDDVVSLCRDPSRPANFGCCLHLIDIGIVMDKGEYDARMQRWLNAIQACPPAPGFSQVTYPGYTEALKLAEARLHGIIAPAASLRLLLETMDKAGLPAHGLSALIEETEKEG